MQPQSLYIPLSILLLQHLLQPPTLPLIPLNLPMPRIQLIKQILRPAPDLTRRPRQLPQQIQLSLTFLNPHRLNLNQRRQNRQIQPGPQHPIFRKLAKRRRIDGFAGLDGRGTAVGGDDGDHFGLFEGLEGGFAGGGFEDVGEEELVVAEGVGVGEGFDEEPGLLGGPLAGAAVEEVHF